MTTQNPGCLGFLMRLFGVGPDVGPAQAANPFPYSVTDSILTQTELAFYRVLRQAVGGTYTIAAKVRLGDIFQVTPGAGAQAAFNRVQSKHVDFLLCEPGRMRPVAGIELDGSSHQLTKERERDQFKDRLYEATGLPLIRIPVRDSYDVHELQGRIMAEIRGQARAPVSPSSAHAARGNVSATVAPTPIVGQRTAPRCPKCGVAMVRRTSTKDGKQFWGCPNFPSCRKIIQIENQ